MAMPDAFAAPPPPGRGGYPPGTEPLWTIKEVAAFLRVSVQTVRRLVARRLLPCVRVGGQLRFVPGDVLRWATARKGA